ncbi:MAG: hypothetical protein ACRDHG_00650, partial [Anaerolineales bacterium]
MSAALATLQAENLVGPLTGFAVEALVGHLVEPGAGLTVDLGQVFELAEGPEVLAEVGNAAAFDWRRGQTFGAERFEKELLAQRQAAYLSAAQQRLITLLGP